MTPASSEVEEALNELEATFPDQVHVETQDETAGMVVRIAGVPLSERWTPRSGDLWFLVPYHYPDAAIYPYYLTAADPSGGLVPALQRVTWRDMPVIQVSLRHTSWNPSHDTALGSVLQTLAWLRTT